MIRAVARALSQLFDPALLGIVLLSAAAAAGVLALCWFGAGELLAHVHLFETGWLDWVARIGAGLTALLVTLALYGSIAAMIAGFMVEPVARAVERRYYPGMPAPRRQKAGEQFRVAVSFLGAALIANLLAAPLYWVWGANVAIFLFANGYVLGREYFELIALRRFDYAAARQLRRAHPFRLLLGGVIIAALSLLPLANLLTPVFATAFMLHLFQGLPEVDRGLSPRPIR